MAKLYGVGVGPGDPDLLTLKAYKLIEEKQVIAFPDVNTAYMIARAAYPQIDKKTLLRLHFHMTKDRDLLKESYQKAAKDIESFLKKGQDVLYLTLGDPSIYSTYIYIDKYIRKLGYETITVPGITSFCAAAARLGVSLSEQSEEIHIIPASYENERALEYDGTKIFMKSGKSFQKLKENIIQKGLDAYVLINCGMEKEAVYKNIREVPDEPGYYTILIIKKSG